MQFLSFFDMECLEIDNSFNLAYTYTEHWNIICIDYKKLFGKCGLMQKMLLVDIQLMLTYLLNE